MKIVLLSPYLRPQIVFTCIDTVCKDGRMISRAENSLIIFLVHTFLVRCFDDSVKSKEGTSRSSSLHK